MGWIEILTGRERRRIWSDDQKLAILEEVATSGLTVADVALWHDVLPQQIYVWRRKFSKGQEKLLQKPCFLPVTLAASEAERLWTYVRDGRPYGSTMPPAACCFCSPDRKGEHLKEHLKNFRGVLHAYGYAGFKDLYAKQADGSRRFWRRPSGRMCGASSSI